MQNLLSSFKAKQAGILLNALQKANDEEFSRFVLENIDAISAWLHSEEFEKEHLQKPFPPLLNPKFLELESSRYCANLAWNLNLPLSIAGGGGGRTPQTHLYLASRSRSGGFCRLSLLLRCFLPTFLEYAA